MEKEDKRKLVAVRVEKDVWERFKKICKKQDTTAAQQVRKLIKQYVAENSQLFV